MNTLCCYIVPGALRLYSIWWSGNSKLCPAVAAGACPEMCSTLCSILCSSNPENRCEMWTVCPVCVNLSVAEWLKTPPKKHTAESPSAKKGARYLSRKGHFVVHLQVWQTSKRLLLPPAGLSADCFPLRWVLGCMPRKLDLLAQRYSCASFHPGTPPRSACRQLYRSSVAPNLKIRWKWEKRGISTGSEISNENRSKIWALSLPRAP